MIFDDCLSAVDARTEKEIIGNLYQYLNDKTAIIITHRIFSLFEFDTIVVIDEGRIVEQGTHAELIGKKGYYADMYARHDNSLITNPYIVSNHYIPFIIPSRSYISFI